MNIKNSHYYLQVKYILLVVIGLLSYFAIYQIAHASYQQTFIISAYYSPVPGQERYATGSYEKDIRLNGSGVRSADGTPVYPGMIAAPKTYAFGTKMNIPGIGIVAVHDRGGAIVQAGQRGYAYDRLDIWMGYGDVGLSRALNWGKRTVNVTVYGIDPSIKPNVYLEGFTEAEKFIRTIISEQKIFKTDLGYESSSDKVGELQQYLTDLGYYKGKIDKYYGDEVYKAVAAFQIDQRIVENAEEFGAGYFGPQTRMRLEAIVEKRRKDKLPQQNLGRDDTGDEVKKLQEALMKLGYDLEANGFYDQKTVNAVFNFQQENSIIDSEEEIGAGYFGPQTLKVLSSRLAALDQPVSQSLESLPTQQAHYVAFEKDLKLGDQGGDVLLLQEELKKFNLLRIEPTGYYGEVTQNAVFKFQQRKGLVSSMSDLGAGSFGPQTRSHLNGILGYRANTNQQIASRTAAFKGEKNTMIAKSVIEPKKESSQPKLVKNMEPGEKGEHVILLQNALIDLGFFSGGLTTDYFGDQTIKAVVAFQLKHGIIASETDNGAGYVGPKTRDKLNEFI